MNPTAGMKLYTVHVRPNVAAAQEKPIFLREGFNWMAFFFTGFWALYHRLWWQTIAIVAFNIVVISLGENRVLAMESTNVIQLGLHVLVGYFANDWVRARLQRRGYVMSDITAADSLLRAEQRYFERYLTASAAH